MQTDATSTTTRTTSPVGLRKGQAPHNDWEKPGHFKGVPFCDKDLEKFRAQNSLNSRLCISLPFSLNLFVLFIKYKAEAHFYSISLPIKVELSPQEIKLSFEMMSYS